MGMGISESAMVISHADGESGVVLNIDARGGTDITDTCMMVPIIKARISFGLPKKPDLKSLA